MLAFGKNAGNLLFVDAVFKYLYVSPNVEMKSDGYRLTTSALDMSVEALNEQYDCLVIPAANWLSGYYYKMLPLYAAKIRKLKIPCVVVGLGAQSNGRDDFSFLNEFSLEAKEFLAAVSEKSHSISVRGEFTGDCLKRLGFRNVNVTGCPSFYRNLQEFSITKKTVSRESFALAVNGSNHLLAELKSDLFESHNSVLFSQGGILKVLKRKWQTPWPDLKRALGDGFSMNLISRGRVRCYGDITPWVDELKKYHFSLGMRIHGNIVALIAGIPAMVIAHDSRTTEMAEFHKIPTVPLHSLKKGFDPYELYLSADYTAMQAQYPDKLANMARFLENNGLGHTLYQKNGQTFYDMKIRTLDFSRNSYQYGGLFFAVASNLSSAFSGMKALRRKISPQHMSHLRF